MNFEMPGVHFEMRATSRHFEIHTRHFEMRSRHYEMHGKFTLKFSIVYLAGRIYVSAARSAFRNACHQQQPGISRNPWHIYMYIPLM